MQVEDIVDGDSFEAWLNARPEGTRQAEAVALATRMALRVFPVWAAALDQSWATERDLTALSVTRMVLTSLVAVKLPTKDVKLAAFSVSVASASASASASADAARASASAAFSADAARASASAAFSADAASASVAAYATRAADVAARSDATVGVWEALRADCHAIEAGTGVMTLALWQSSEASVPEDLQTAWEHGKKVLQAQGDQDFWIRWYEAALAGRPLTGDWDSHWQMLHDIALIPDAEWGEGTSKDAAPIAGLIEAIEQKFRYRVSGDTLASADVLLRSAIGQFGFDDIKRLMALLPFAEDLKHLKDPKAVEDFVLALNQQQREIEVFLRALEREGRGLQGAGGILTYFEEILEEAAKARQLNSLNVGWVVDCGEILQSYARDAETLKELGPLSIPFKRTVQNLLDLIHGHFSATILRFGVLRDIRSSEETRLVDVLEDLKRGLAVIKDELPKTHFAMTPETMAVFEKLFAELERLIKREFTSNNPESKAQLRKDIDYRLAQLAVSMRLYWEQSAAPRAAIGEIAGKVAKKKVQQNVEGVVEMAMSAIKPGS